MRLDVILLRDVKKLGEAGRICSPVRGYANFLLREKLALKATEANKAYYKAQKEKLAQENKALFAQAQTAAQELENLYLHVIRPASDAGQLYGSVTVKDLKVALGEKISFPIKSSMIVLPMPIRAVGLHVFSLHVHASISVDVRVAVARTAQEALRLAEENKSETQQADAKQEPAEKDSQPSSTR